MKKVISICLLAVAVFIGGLSMEAKTPSKKKTTKTTQTSKKNSSSASYSLVGNRYTASVTENGGRASVSIKFMEGGKGDMHVFVYMFGVSNSDSVDFTWKLRGDKVYLSDAKGNKDVYTVVDNGNCLKNEKGVLFTLEE